MRIFKQNNLKLKQIISLFLSAALLVFLAMPAGFSTSSNALPQAAKNAAQAEKANQIFVNIKVVSAAQTSSVVFSQINQPQLPASCSFLGQSSLGLVQDAGTLNLNQPANCFSLKLAYWQQSQSLAVQPLPSRNYNVAVIRVPVITWGYSLPNPVQSLPMLPAAAAGLGIMAAVSFRKLQAVSLRQLNFLFPRSLSIEQLQMFRC